MPIDPTDYHGLVGGCRRSRDRKAGVTPLAPLRGGRGFDGNRRPTSKARHLEASMEDHLAACSVDRSDCSSSSECSERSSTEMKTVTQRPQSKRSLRLQRPQRPPSPFYCRQFDAWTAATSTAQGYERLYGDDASE